MFEMWVLIAVHEILHLRSLGTDCEIVGMWGYTTAFIVGMRHTTDCVFKSYIVVMVVRWPG